MREAVPQALVANRCNREKAVKRPRVTVRSKQQDARPTVLPLPLLCSSLFLGSTDKRDHSTVGVVWIVVQLAPPVTFQSQRLGLRWKGSPTQEVRVLSCVCRLS